MSLNNYQIDAINSEGNLLITACPGSGKTTVLSLRAEKLLLDQQDSSVLAVTFTRDAAEELKNRILTKVPYLKDKIEAGTFHSLAMNQIKQSGIKISLIDELQSENLIQQSLNFHKINNIKPNQIKHIFSSIQSSINPNDHPYLHTNLEIKLVWQKYSELKITSQVADFNDLLHIAIELIKNKKIKPYPMKYILADEAQDMDEVQHEWIELHRKHGSKITLVGDDDQSVYGFRYASGFKGMMDFKNKSNAKQLVLPVNYRCGEDILMLAKKLIKKNTKRIEKPIKAGLRHKGTVLKPIPYLFEDNLSKDPKNEILGIVEELKKQHLKNKSFMEWTVLSRNNIFLQNLEIELIENKIPYHRDSGSIWDSRYAKSYLAVLEYIANNKWFPMSIFLSSFIESEFLMASPNMNLKALYKAEEKGIDPIQSKKNQKIISEFINLEQEWNKLIFSKKDTDLNFCIEDIANFVIANIKALVTTPKAEQTAMQAISLCSSILKRNKGNLKQRLHKELFLKKDHDQTSYKIQEAKKNKSLFVNLMTMHSSKGLEFDNVWIAGVDDYNLLKLGSNRQAEVDIEEERRLLYVAMTRAKKTLGFSYSRFENEEYCTFLKEMEL